MKYPPKHRNITLKRMVLDFYQHIRSQSFVVQYMGPQFTRSRKHIEIDVTYKCNLKCLNCNRSCTQAPSRVEMSIEQIQEFIQSSIEKGIQWERIRILGGEPTLHSNIHEIIDRLRHYRKRYNPAVRLVIGTNFYGSRVKGVVASLPEDVQIKSTLKTSRVNLFRPFNKAPVDSRFHRFSDFSCGCRIIADCGIGLTPSGYYPCAIAGSIDRVFRLDLGRKRMPENADSMVDLLTAFCRYCGHFGFAWPVRKRKISKTWENAYQAAHSLACDSETNSR